MDTLGKTLSIVLGIMLAVLIYNNTGIEDYFAEMGIWGRAMGAGLFVGGAGVAAGYIGHEAYRRLFKKKDDD